MTASERKVLVEKDVRRWGPVVNVALRGAGGTYARTELTLSEAEDLSIRLCEIIESEYERQARHG